MNPSLEQEGTLLLVAMPVSLVLTWRISRDVSVWLSPLPMFAWFLWFTTWASKGGMPRRF